MAGVVSNEIDGAAEADWHRRVVGRSLRSAKERSVDRGRSLIVAAGTVLERSDGEDITVQEVADEAGQSLRTLYQYFQGKDDLLLAVFEEAMRTYAQMIRRAISDLDDPLDRLAGAVIAAVRMPEYSGTGVDRGLSRLRLKLSEVEPELMGKAQAAVIELIGELVGDAAAAKRIKVTDTETATFMILSLNAAFITTGTIGNDAGVRRPDAAGIATFCLQGLGAQLDEGWFKRVSASLQLPSGRPRSKTQKRAPKKKN